MLATVLVVLAQMQGTSSDVTPPSVPPHSLLGGQGGLDAGVLQSDPHAEVLELGTQDIDDLAAVLRGGLEHAQLTAEVRETLLALLAHPEFSTDPSMSARTAAWLVPRVLALSYLR